MAQTNHIDVTVTLLDGSTEEYKHVHYISFVSSPGGQGEGTYGIPALISDPERKREGLPLRVLYVNPANITSMIAERHG